MTKTPPQTATRAPARRRYGSIIEHIEASTAFQAYALSARSLPLYALFLSVAVGILYLFERVRFRRVAV